MRKTTLYISTILMYIQCFCATESMNYALSEDDIDFDKLDDILPKEELIELNDQSFDADELYINSNDDILNRPSESSTDYDIEIDESPSDDLNKKRRYINVSFKVAKKLKSMEDKRPFKCLYESCNMTFKLKSVLKKHEVTQHSDERPFKCIYNGCDQTFKTYAYLKRHEIMHSDEKPFKCLHENCGLAFKRNTDLKEHKVTHSDKRPFKCTYEGCSKFFKRNSDLKQHEIIHSDERPFKCLYEGCSKSFKRNLELKRHQKSKDHFIINEELT